MPPRVACQRDEPIEAEKDFDVLWFLKLLRETERLAMAGSIV